MRFQTLIGFGTVSLLAWELTAQPFVPNDLGTTVAGFQDDFTGTGLGANWFVSGANVYSVSNGALHVASATGDPNHLLYQAAGYDNTVQEVLVRIRISSFGSGDGVRGGVGLAVTPSSSQGINYLLRDNISDNQTANHLSFLDDRIVWGPVQNFVWQANTWYWLRLRHEPNAAGQGGVNDVFGKVWLADGSQPEPASWQLAWDYTSSFGVRSGYAGITASSGGACLFDVDYVLIKAAGFPAIMVAPSAFVQAPVRITNQPQNQIVLELLPAVFRVGASGYPAPTYQWYSADALISGATNSTYTLNSAPWTANGSVYYAVAQNVISNISYAVTSSVVSLTVIADTNAPALLSAQALGLTQVQVSFSERISPGSGTNVGNYTISGGVVIRSATLDSSQTNVVLGVTPMTDGGLYSVTVNLIVDQSHLANIIAPDSKAQFIASPYAPIAIGNPVLPGSQVPAGNGYNITAGGSGIGGTNDQFQLSYQVRTGDFDVAVRLDSLGLADAWSEAGLMAREDLTAGARFAATLATPTITGAFFESRGTTNGTATLTGTFPVNYPKTWLRLKRAGTLLSGFGSFDGQSWTQLGSATLNLPASIYLGFVVCSGSTNQTTTAGFRDFGPVTGATAAATPVRESLAQCSRRTSLVISEIMYHPTNAALEYIELFNSRAEFQDLSGYQLAGSINYTFPQSTVIPGGGFLVVARSPSELQTFYGLTGILGPYTNNLPNDKGTVRLLSQAGALLLEINYSDQPPWPVAADGAGHSLVLARPSYGEDNVLAWSASDALGGSPGRLDPFTPDPLRNVVINEFLAHTDPPDYDYVELYNHSRQAVDISGCTLTDDITTNKFFIPAGTILQAGGFVSFSETNLHFGLSAGGETIYFKNPGATRVLDAVRFEAQENGIATGRLPDGGERFYRLAKKSPGNPNGEPARREIVINEIMYAPISLNDDDQYLELYNAATNAVDLGGWQFTDGVTFAFPPNLVIQPESCLVVARNASRMLTNYPNLNSRNLVGNFGGSLSHNGERIALAKPDALVTTNALGVVETNTILIVVDEVTYGTGGRWGQWSEAGGSSLELIDPHADNRLAPNWADSDETTKAPWTLISATGTIDNGDTPADELQLLLQGQGEVLVDNVQVLDSTANNRITNGTFEAGSAGWVAEGTEKTSTLETTGGYNSSQSYHLRAVEKGDNQINRVRTLLGSPLPASSANVTIRAAVRWLKGDPEILLRLRGNWLECAGELSTPINPGTPGARNSRYLSNAPPAIIQVSHSPILPGANEPIIVSAQIIDPDGIAAAALKYRIDPATSYTSVPLKDDGTGGDAIASDGVYSATVPGQPAGTLIAFYLQATDQGLQPASSTFPDNAPTRECLVRTGELQPTGNYPVYRVWMTSSNLNTWNSNPKLDNSFNDVTFALGNTRVIYNAGGRYKGSPYISPGYSGPTQGRCGYSFSFPADDLFQGEQELVLDWPGGHGGETTALQEQMCYWMADRMGLPWSHRHTIRLHVNGVTDDTRHTTFEAVVQPDGSFIHEWSAHDADGQFFKIERAFEFSDTGGLLADPQPRLQLYTTTGGMKKLERYRWTWMFRSTNRRNDYSNIFALVDAVNATAPEPYTSATLGLVDMEEWMGIFATEHIIENFDAYGHQIGKNMYAYLPESGSWQLYMFDLDWAMLAAANFSSTYAASAGPLFNCDDPLIARMYAFPPFARAYWRAVQNAVNGPLASANCNPVLDAKSQSLFANGIRWCDGRALTPPDAVKTWFSQRRAALQAQLATVASPFAVDLVVVSNNVALLSGRAPIGVQTIRVNGVAWPITWNNVTGWVTTVPLQPGTNVLNVLGLDTHGQLVTGASSQVTAVYSRPLDSPAGQIVVSEIMYRPPTPRAEYVEFYNNSSTQTFDLSGWETKGLSYTFPNGSLIGPHQYLVLAANRASFAAAYGATNLVFDTFTGTLQADGETLSLIVPGTNSSPDYVTRVRYRNRAPWPDSAIAGTALQLIDSAQDNWRGGNWGLAAATPGRGNFAAAVLPTFPPLWLNEIQADNLNGITNGIGRRSGWIELFNPSSNTVSLAGLCLSTNYGALTAWVFPPGAVISPGGFKLIFADGQSGLSNSNELHTGFTLSSGSGALALSRVFQGQPQVLDYLEYTNLGVDHAYGSVPDGQTFDREEFALPTPGASNRTVIVGSYIAYTSVGQVYVQNFDALPNPGLTSVNTANPVTIEGITYALANPFDFAEPAVATGNTGGLGIDSLAGWYGRGAVASKFGATDGDQTTGGEISFGLPASSNRALGLLATSSTGGTGFGAKFVNQTRRDLRYFTLRFTGELWRQSDLPKTLQFYYFIDPTAAAPFSSAVTALIPFLNVSFPTSGAATGGVAVDGTAAQNQIRRSIINQVVTNWPDGAALWLVWEMSDATGKSQGIGIDNLSFAAADQPLEEVGPGLNVQTSGTDLVMSWLSLPGQTYQIEYKDELSPGVWTALGSPILGTGGVLTITNPIHLTAQRFYRLRLVP